MSTEKITEIITAELLAQGPINLAERYPADKFILAFPTKVVTYLPPGMQLVPRIISLSPNPDDGDVYETPKKKKTHRSISSNGAYKLEKIIGVEWLDMRHERERDPHSKTLLCNLCTVRGRYLDYTGKFSEITASASIDFVALKESGNYSPDDIKQRLIHSDEQTESKAKRRGTLKALCLQDSYPIAEFKKKFVAFTMQVILDPTNAIDRMIMLNRGSEAQKLLYSPQDQLPDNTNYTFEPENNDIPLSNRSGDDHNASQGPKAPDCPSGPAGTAPPKTGPDINSQIENLAKKVGHKLASDWKDLSDKSKQGLLTMLKNKEAAHAK